ncbi:MAG: hypothetical protein KME26_21115 [Oscillatoria princeps RMCB-10]|nr:hypothetical protein [Oscillatoria princeps RMCB-10]
MALGFCQPTWEAPSGADVGQASRLYGMRRPMRLYGMRRQHPCEKAGLAEGFRAGVGDWCFGHKEDRSRLSRDEKSHRTALRAMRSGSRKLR